MVRVLLTSAEPRLDLRCLVGELQGEGDARGLDEHHGIRVKEVVSGVTVDL